MEQGAWVFQWPDQEVMTPCLAPVLVRLAGFSGGRALVLCLRFSLHAVSGSRGGKEGTEVGTGGLFVETQGSPELKEQRVV